MLIGLSCLSVTGCEVTDSNMQTTSEGPIAVCGALPNSPPPNDIASIQSHVIADLADGLGDDVFTSDAPSPDTAILEIGGGHSDKNLWSSAAGKRQLYLVARHLQKLTHHELMTDSVSPLQENFCRTGTLLTGYAAAKPFLSREVEGAALHVTQVTAYGLLVCVGASGRNYRVTPSHTIPDNAVIDFCSSQKGIR